MKNGTNLFVIIQNNPIKLNFTVPEKDIEKIKVGQDLILKVDAMPDKEFKGKTIIIYPNVDEMTRTLKVEALVPNSSGLLKPGLFASVTLYTALPRDVILVPIISLLYEGTDIKVFVIEGDKAMERIIKTDQKIGEMVEVVEGIKEGEQIAVAGQQNLSEGVKVNVAR